MLVAVEGPSAVGKTTLLSSAAPAEGVVGEEWEALGIPRGSAPPRPQAPEAQQFWVDLNARRWDLLLKLEERQGAAYADTDPLKLYYNFALAGTGEVPREVFEEGWRRTREAVREHRLGFVDRVVYLEASRDTLSRRKAHDTTRTRSNFELHARLTDAMQGYYAALEKLRPGTLRWLDAEGPMPESSAFAASLEEAPRYERYDLASLDQLERDLDRLLRAGSP